MLTEAKPKKRRTTDADVHIGENMRRIRVLKRMSQQEVAAEIGVAYQQYQRYEVGTNRLAASRLLRFCEAMACSINEVCAGALKPEARTIHKLLGRTPSKVDFEVIHAFNAIPSVEQKQAALRLLQAMAG